MSPFDFFVDAFHDTNGLDARFAANDPGKAAFYAIAGTSFVFFVAPIAIDGIVLPMIGFGSTGVIGGSIAAAWQSSMGSVIAPSVFSTLQSAAMGGYGIAAVHAVVISTTALGTAVAALFTVKNADNVWESVGKEDAEKAAASGQAVLNITPDASGFIGNTLRQIWEDEGNQEKIQAAQAFVGNEASEASKLLRGLVGQVAEVYQRPEYQEKIRQAGCVTAKISQDATAFFRGMAANTTEFVQRPENQEKLQQAGEVAAKVGQDAAVAFHAAASWFRRGS